MSTATWTNLLDMTTDAGFRVVGVNISTNLQAVNTGILTKTTDTGQINFVTVTKPTVAATSAGYEIYNFTDSKGTLFLKLEYGTGVGATSFGMWTTWGTGTNGAGTITGILSARTQADGTAVASSTTTAYPSYACCVNGSLWLISAAGCNASANGNSAGAFGITRTCDATGANTSDGYESWTFSSAAFTAFAVNLTTLNVFTSTTGGHCLIPYSIASSAYGGTNLQTWRHEIPMPQTFISAQICSYIITEIGTATTFVYAVAGSTTHTFFFSGLAVTKGANASISFGLGLIYE